MKKAPTDIKLLAQLASVGHPIGDQISALTRDEMVANKDDAAAVVAKYLEAKGFGRAWPDISHAGNYFGVMCEGPSDMFFLDLSKWPEVEVIGKAYELNRDGDILDKEWKFATSGKLTELDPTTVWSLVADLSFYAEEDEDDENE